MPSRLRLPLIGLLLVAGAVLQLQIAVADSQLPGDPMGRAGAAQSQP